MSTPADRIPVNQDEYWEVSHAAGRLTSYACSLSAQFIQDGVLRLEFNGEVAGYMEQIVREFENGTKNFKQATDAILEEHGSLIRQAADYGKLVIGLAAGGFQVAGGVAICAGVVTCAMGTFLIAHGANNIYENGNNILTGRLDIEGPTRKVYQGLARAAGGDDSDGNIAYYTADISLSLYGLLRKIPGPDSWRLFHYADKDFLRA